MKKNKNNNAYLRLSSAGIQMGVIIFLGAYFGNKLDLHYQNKNHLFTIILSLLGVAIGLYIIIKEVIQISNNEK